MIRDESIYLNPPIFDNSFPIYLECQGYEHAGTIFPNHWHEHIEFLYIVEGEGVIESNSIPVYAKKGDLVVINSNDIHYGRSLTDKISYYCMIIDPLFFKSNIIGSCEFKYINPILRNYVILKHRVSGDKVVQECVNKIIKEFEEGNYAYEMAIKSYVYELFVLLLRHHTERVLSEKEYTSKVNKLQKLTTVLEYLTVNYTEDITIDKLAHMANISSYYLCHIFKEITGKTVSEYVNFIRVNKAEYLLRNTEMNVTEIALATGFNDINYFSRVFKKFKKVSPTSIRKV